MKIYLTNSLSKQKEEFAPLKSGQVGLYSCGPTVYDYPHIGNWRAYIVWDVLKRFLSSQGYAVNHIMNITDVGHLTSDADDGEDKMQLASQRTGKDAWAIADFFIKVFQDGLQELNILPPTKFVRATACIKEQIDFVKELESKGFLYRLADGLYFDTAKSADYGRLANLGQVQIQAGARVAVNPEKKHPADFAVWKFSPANSPQRDMEWDSPWGKGFPGWHLECSVISRLNLGDTFDIHTGGVDHLTIHHPNEMAQSQAVTGKVQARYWLHNDFVKFMDGKMSKSLGSFITLQDLQAKKLSPLAYRYLVLQTHYRKPMNFTWEALAAAVAGLTSIVGEIVWYNEPGEIITEQLDKFNNALADDLNIAKALAVLQETIALDMDSSRKLATIYRMDEVLGLNLKILREQALMLPAEAQELLVQRLKAKNEKNWELADKLREDLAGQGIAVQDTKEGQKAVKMRI